jgi:hypothetical protein
MKSIFPSSIQHSVDAPIWRNSTLTNSCLRHGISAEDSINIPNFSPV